MTRGWHSGWQPGQPPPQVQLWWWGPGAGTDPQRPGADVSTSTPTTPVRIGDAERDTAMSDLGDHFAAGRLSREEFDERADQAMQARFSTDLDPLFVDLPKPAPAPPQSGGPRPAGGPPPWAYAMWLLPFVLIAALVGGIFFHAPFLLWALIWVAVILKITGHRRRHRHQQLSRPGPR